MLPQVVTPSHFRQHLAEWLERASKELILIKGSRSNRVLMDEREFNRLAALADQFIQEDPEGKYRPKFEKEILKRMTDEDVDTSVRSLRDLL